MTGTPCWATSSSDYSKIYYRPKNYYDFVDHLKRAMEIIQTQWPFVQVASVHEFVDKGLIEHRQSFFGLVDKQLKNKSSGLVVMKKVKNTSSIVSTTTSPIIESVTFPYDSIQTNTLYFS